MDVNSINKNKEYLDGSVNILHTTQCSNSNNKNLVKNTSIAQNPKNQQLLEKENDNFKKDDLDKAVNKLNKFLEDDNVHAVYSIHKDLGTLMIKIVNDDTDKVILELPPEKILNMVASMCKQMGLLDEKV